MTHLMYHSVVPRMMYSIPSIGITCDNPMDAVSAKRDHEFYCGAEMIFECAEGFKMVGSHKMRCMETGNWSNHMPLCEYTPESM